MAGGSITYHIPDDQIGKVVEVIELDPKWLEEVLAIISVREKVEMVKKQRYHVQKKLRRIVKAYVDGLILDEEYRRCFVELQVVFPSKLNYSCYCANNMLMD